MTETVTHAIHGGVEGERFPAEVDGQADPRLRVPHRRPDTGEICDEGETGELLIRGTRGIQMFLEYYDNPEANAKSFSEDGWFHTGDLRAGRRRAATIFYSERDKDLLKVGGENVSAREVEDSAARSPGVADVAVVGKKHDWLDQVAVAFVIKGAERARRRGALGGRDRHVHEPAGRLQGAAGCLLRRRTSPGQRWKRSPRTSCAKWRTPKSESYG